MHPEDKNFANGEDPKRNCNITLNEEQLTILKMFREKVGPIVPEWRNSDVELSRWLIARNFCLQKAEDMLLKSLEWRKNWNVDKSLEWTPPEVLQKYYPVGFSGYSKEGVPVIITPFGNADIRGLLHCCSIRDVLKYFTQFLERTMLKFLQHPGSPKNPVTSATILLDMENFSFTELTYKPCLDAIFQLIQTYEANYPEIIKWAYVINAPKIFSAFFALVKPFMSEHTIRKVKIYGTSGWKEVVLNEISPDQLPVHWGGTMTDPDGNPMCPSKIGLGGKIPLQYYNNSNTLDGSFTTIVLPKFGKKVIDGEVLKANTELRWMFYSEDHDVAYQITLETPSGDQEIIIPYQRVNSHMFPEEGSFLCSDPGTYNILFDNSYSYLRSKRLHYSVELIEPN